MNPGGEKRGDLSYLSGSAQCAGDLTWGNEAQRAHTFYPIRIAVPLS